VVDAVVGGGGVVRVPVDGVMAELGEGKVLSGEMDSAVRDGALRTLPGVHGGDGFFAVILQRV
jgi:16S rRNA (cytosine967-C5)-methyltransferase